jgi:hypothetical protein
MGMVLASAYPYPDGGPHGLPIPRPGPDGYSKDQYFQYINVPGPKVFEWGYRRGVDPDHFREEYLSQKEHTFKAKVKWADAHGGYGEHFYDYNHGPQQGYGKEEPSYHAPEPHAPVYSPPHGR